MLNLLRRYQTCFGSVMQKRFYRSNPFFKSALENQSKVAIVDNKSQKQFTYSDLIKDSETLACKLQKENKDIKGKRVCFLFDPSYDYVVANMAIWMCGATCVPLCNSHPSKELEYYIQDSQSNIVLYGERFEDVIKPLKDDGNEQVNFKLLKELHAPQDHVEKDAQQLRNTEYNENDRALFIYTSGTTGPPKGVVSTHRTIMSQISSLVQAWEWRSTDHIMHVLPLHHVHGVVNVLLCPLHVGASLTFVRFDNKTVFHQLFDDNTQNPSGLDYTLFMAVPTIYVKLISYYKSLQPKQQEEFTKSNKNSKIRLMVCGSAALPTTVFEEWKKISGHTLLERYGMTEIGMALSNPLHGDRIPGSVGTTLPLVRAKLQPTQEEEEASQEGAQTGELYIAGPTVFTEYWNKPEATKKTFEGEWFKTGDFASMDENGVYRILGRLNADIIKTRGYKVSALDVERHALEHPSIHECAVMGIEDKEWGEKIVALIVLHDGKADVTASELREFLKDKMASYKIPSELKIVKEIPKNAMGKVNKKQLKSKYVEL
ncbi:malonyl-CoA/methylmalonyl-CoA synthetase [Acrasis kona]|uniref:Malonyl-CoA/methylmalonyl-CoA synthetase n=1 Tax=Acrasis kona TaxID=1008807 RepID=A0AAW2Z753_9EUKA